MKVQLVWLSAVQMCRMWTFWISCLLCFNVQVCFNTLIHVVDSFDHVEPCFPRAVVHLCHLLKLFLLDRSLFDLHHCFLLLLVILLQTFRILKWVDHHRLQKIGGLAEYCWTTWTIPHRSCYCWSVSSHYGSDFRCWTIGWDATKMWNFQQMMMTMNPTLMNSPCSCLSVYQPCRGPQADTTGPEPSPFSTGTLSTVGHSTAGHSTSGPGPSQCDPMTTRRRRTVDKQLGPYGFQLRSTSPTSAGAQLGSAVQHHNYGGLHLQST